MFLSLFCGLKYTFLKVTRVVTLAPPMKFTPTTQLSGGTFLHGGHTKINQAFHACGPWRLSLSGLPPQDPYTQLILPLIVVLLCNCF